MGIIEDAYQFGTDRGLTRTRGYGIHSIVENLSRGQEIASSLTPDFFSEYKEYAYTKSNADLVFQTIYFAVMDRIADQLKYNIKSEYAKFRGQIIAGGLFSEFTGEKSGIRRVVEIRGTPLEKLIQNYTLSTGHKPDNHAVEQLKLIIYIGDRIARQHGASKDNINWSDFDLHLQPGMTSISPEHMNEIREELTELFTEPTVREMLKDALAIFNDHRYNLILAWYGGSQITAFYKGKELNVVTLGSVPENAKQAETIMARMSKEDEEYPEYFASDSETWNELLRLKQQR